MVLAASAQGRSVLESVLLSDDTRYMSDTLRVMGFTVEIDEPARRITVSGRGGTIPAHGGEIFVDGAGTVMRFIVAMVTLGNGRFRIDGNQRMRQRPIGPQLDAMQRLGASVYSERDNNCPPVMVDASRARFEGGETSVDARASSQFVSAMLMPAPIWKAGLKLEVIGNAARPFIAMTLRLMEAWGAESTVEDDLIVVPGGQWYRAQRFVVEPDASSASYFAAAAALVGGTVRVEGLTSNSVQGDLGFLGVLQRWARASCGIPIRRGRRRRPAHRGRRRDELDAGYGRDARGDRAVRIFADDNPQRRVHPASRERSRPCARDRTAAARCDGGRTMTGSIAPSAMHPAAVETYDDHRIAMSSR